MARNAHLLAGDVRFQAVSFGRPSMAIPSPALLLTLRGILPARTEVCETDAHTPLSCH